MFRFSLIISLLCGLILTTQTRSLAEPLDPDQERRAQIGAALYAEHCANCHRPLAETTKPQRSFSRLRSSIQRFPAMAWLDFLNDQQLEALAAALKTIPLDN